MTKYEQLKEIINSSNKIVVFTGAGISCPPPTNIKDFRSSNGLYNEKTKYNIPPERIISHSFFTSRTKEFFEFYSEKMVFPKARYNEAHKYFANLGKRKDVTIVTQNIDNLHTAAGSEKVLELHGNVFRNYCMKCGKYYDLKDINIKDIPKCTCGGIIKPDVVLYEEPLDNAVINGAIKCISECDLLIVVGTSLTVYPAASFIRYFRGKNLVLINKDKTNYDDIAQLVFNEDIINVIMKLN